MSTNRLLYMKTNIKNCPILKLCIKISCIFFIKSLILKETIFIYLLALIYIGAIYHVSKKNKYMYKN
jgi:hypothetical protein